MRILFRKLLRDLRESKGQFIATLIVVVIGVMFYTGINATFRNLSGASEKYYKEYRFADLFVSVIRAPESIADKLEQLPGVKMASGRLVQDVKITISGENAVIRLITLPDEKTEIVNDIVIKAGRYFSLNESNQCLVEEDFFKAHGLTAGDNITAVINGAEVRLRITGSAKSPEYVYPVKDGSELIPDNRKFGIVYVKNSFGQAILDMNGSVNDISILLNDSADIKKVRDDVEKLLDNYGITALTEREDQISNRMLSEEMNGLKSTAGAFPVVFFIVAAAIIYIMMGRIVENQRIQIGVLKAFGFKDTQVLAHYLSFSLVIGITGSIIGTVMGMFLGKSFTQLENMYFNLPPADMKVYPELAVPASLLTIFFCLLAGYNACKLVFRIMPGEAMRPKAPVAGRRILLEKVKLLWAKFSYSWKITLRNLFRNKKRAALTSVGVFFSAALLVIGFGSMDSFNYLIAQQYSTVQNYDIKVNFTRFISYEELNYIRSLPYVTKLEPVIETGVEIRNGWKKKNIGFVALESGAELYRVTDKNGNAVNIPSSGIMIPEKLADTLGVVKFDRVVLKPFYPDMKKKEVAVKGLVTQYLGLSAYSSMEAVRQVFGESGMANSAVLKLQATVHEKEVIDKLKELPVSGSIQSKSDAMNNLMKNMAAMKSSMGVMILLAGVLSMAVVYNIATINIFERQRELATLKVLGFRDREVQKLVFNENFIITFIGIALGLPCGGWLGKYMMTAFETDAYTIPFYVLNRTYAIAAVLTIIFTFAANLIVVRKIKRIKMVEVLKSNE